MISTQQFSHCRLWYTLNAYHGHAECAAHLCNLLDIDDILGFVGARIDDFGAACHLWNGRRYQREAMNPARQAPCRIFACS